MYSTTHKGEIKLYQAYIFWLNSNVRRNKKTLIEQLNAICMIVITLTIEY